MTRWTDGRRPVTVSFDVRNDGSRAGTETPQVYLTWATLPGQYQVQAGSSAQDLPLTAPVLVG